MWRRVAAGLALLSLAFLTACTSPEPTAPPDGIRFEVMQGRTDYTSGTLVLRVINEGNRDITLSNAVLSWPGFADQARWAKRTEISAGRTVDLRTDVPAPACDTEPADAPTLSVELGGATVEAAPSDPLGTLPRLHETGCVTQRVDRVTSISTTGPLAIDGTGVDAIARLTLLFTPTGEDGTVQVSSVSSTPLLATEDGAETWPLSVTVTAASGEQSVTLGIRPARCDPHAIAEDKIGTVLVIRVAANGIDGEYRYPVDDATRDALYGFVRSACGMA